MNRTEIRLIICELKGFIDLIKTCSASMTNKLKELKEEIMVCDHCDKKKEVIECTKCNLVYCKDCKEIHIKHCHNS